MQSYESTLTLRLSAQEKAAIDEIVKEQLRVTTRTSTGALRQDDYAMATAD